MARLREATGGGVWPLRIASSAALFQSVTTSAWARVVVKSAVATDHVPVLQNGKSMLFMACLTCAIQKSGFKLWFQRGRARGTRPSLLLCNYGSGTGGTGTCANEKSHCPLTRRACPSNAT